MGRANCTGGPPILTAPFPVLIVASILLASCANTPQGATPKVYTGKLTFASFNPFTGPDSFAGTRMAGLQRGITVFGGLRRAST
jgi:hypothetical protein